jgi:hypothetical protein
MGLIFIFGIMTKGKDIYFQVGSVGRPAALSAIWVQIQQLVKYH